MLHFNTFFRMYRVTDHEILMYAAVIKNLLRKKIKRFLKKTEKVSVYIIF